MSVTMREMLECGVHFGHQTRFWNPRMAPYIFGHRNKIHIVNLEKTLEMYQAAIKFARQLTANRGTILFVATKRQARDIIREEAQRAGTPYVDDRWLGGMLTNYKTVKQSIKRLKDMQARDRAAALLRLAQRGLAQGRGIDPAQALPLYLRDQVALTTAQRQAVAALGPSGTPRSAQG